ncbi:unnamed protein product [Adineta steineri]|uniref:Uncharacterized protein n=1 Tax=Adineta steineri TaxID=433720 RepID=A0A814I763_9BILA|nr:unnamed protein product [Adineta steineri]CAF1112258.1 unnamed protein product [Adineta steineri]
MIFSDTPTITRRQDKYNIALDSILSSTADEYLFENSDNILSTNDADTGEIPEFLCNVFHSEFYNERLPNATELSVMLLFTWKRHCLNKAIAKDICRILNRFDIPNMPKGFREVMPCLKTKILLYLTAIIHLFVHHVGYTAKDPSKDRACGHASLCVLSELTHFEMERISVNKEVR